MSNLFKDETEDMYLHSDMDEDHYDDYNEHDEDDDLPTETPHDDKQDPEQTNQENINEMIQRDKKWLVQRKVINEAMIREAVREELFLDYDKVYVPDAEDIDLRDTKALVLSFRSIDSINNLHGLQNLRKLQLDNNLIEKITNLDHLINLEWLDLSFNFIKEIEGLDKLTKLKDLTLFNNRITSLAGLEKLTNLTILSVGNNYIRDLEQIRNLRRLKSLRALNLRGNPIAKEDDYIHTALAYLPDLKYLDYQLVSTKQLKDAYDKKMEVVLEMVQQEQHEHEQAESDKEKESHLATLDAAGLRILRDLFDTLVKRDKEMGRLQILPGFMIILDQYRQQFVAIMDDLIADCLQQQELKRQEEAGFASAITRVIEESEQKLLSMKSVFEHDIKLAIASKNGEALVAAKKAALALSDSMMEVEMESVRAISTMMEEYVEVYAKIGKNTENRYVNVHCDACYYLLCKVSGSFLVSLFSSLLFPHYLVLPYLFSLQNQHGFCIARRVNQEVRA